MRLVSKSRLGAKTKRRYDVARTPCDRVLEADEVAAARKAELRRQYCGLDPVALLAALRDLQDRLWALGYSELPSRRGGLRREPEEQVVVAPPAPSPAPAPVVEEARTYHKMRRAHKKHKKHKPYVHWWRTYPDAFESVWGECEQELKRQPNLAASVLLKRLQVRHPGAYDDSQLRTLQRRVRAWRIEQVNVPLPRRQRGDSLPEAHEIEVAVHCSTRNAAELLQYDFG